MEDETLTMPKAQVPEEEGDLTMSESPQQPDSEDDDEAEDSLRLQGLEKELSDSPSNYDAHVELIKLLRKMGDLDKLRMAREAMNVLFPLTPSMWQDWARDESSLITPGTEACSTIEKLYERGVSDYLSASLWCDYLDFIQEYDPSVRECSPAGISKARDLFERAVTSTGLHAAEGNKIWETYIEFEQAVLHTIDEMDIQAKEKQIHRIQSIFQRQLSVPLVDMRSTLLKYKAWEVDQGRMLDMNSGDLDGLSTHVASAYQKASDMYNARAQHEESVSAKDIPDLDKFQAFMNYLKFEKSSGDPTRVQLLYERAISDFPVSTDLWLDYTRYLDQTLKVGTVVTTAYSRAIKNCPWIGELWVRYLLSLERNRASEKEIASAFEKALQCTFSNIDEYRDLFLTRVDGLRRRILFTNEVDNALDYSLIRETFQNASEYLAPHLKYTDSFLRLHSYWAHLELNLGKNVVAARGVWESLLKSCGSMLEVWEGYIAMEIELGHMKEARSLYKRCYSKRFPATGSEDICHLWVRFEREFGTLEDLDHAKQKVSSRLEELQLFRSREESKLAEEREAISKKNVREKRKPVSDVDDEHHKTKRQKDMGKHQSKGHEKDKAQNNVEKKQAEVGITQVEEPDIEKEMQTIDSLPQRARVYTDQCTVFVSNLHLKVNSEDLRKFFSDVGGVVGIRILHDKFTGKSRGLAYVDFSDAAHVDSAVAKNRQALFGKKLSIAKSNPKRGKRDQSGRSHPGEKGDSASERPVAASKASSGPQGPHINTRKPRLDNIEFKGKNTFAVPRNVSTSNQTANKQETNEEGDEKPKSNDQFRQMLLKGESS